MASSTTVTNAHGPNSRFVLIDAALSDPALRVPLSAVWDTESVRIVSMSSTRLELERGLNGSGASAHAAGSTITIGSRSDPAMLNLPVSAGPLALLTGQVRLDSARGVEFVYDGVRERPVSPGGFQPYAYSCGGNLTTGAATGTVLPALGGAVAVPITLDSPMIVQSMSWRNLDAATARSLELSIYEDPLGNNVLLNRLPAFDVVTDTFTPGAASTRTKNIATPGSILPEGTYWIVARNPHATSTYQIGGQGSGTMALNGVRTLTLAAALAAAVPLDFSTSWTPATGLVLIRLNGRAFGEAAAY